MISSLDRLEYITQSCNHLYIIAFELCSILISFLFLHIHKWKHALNILWHAHSKIKLVFNFLMKQKWYLYSGPHFLKLKQQPSLWLEIKWNKYDFFFYFMRKKKKPSQSISKISQTFTKQSIPPDIVCRWGDKKITSWE